jgi:hypothetical protein
MTLTLVFSPATSPKPPCSACSDTKMGPCSLTWSGRPFVNLPSLLLVLTCTASTPPYTQPADRPKKKKFYKLYFLKEWIQALQELKVLAPLISLCSGEWKADLTLENVLQDEPSTRSEPPPPEPPPLSSTPSSVGLSHIGFSSHVSHSSHLSHSSHIVPSFCVGSPSHVGPPSSHVTSHTAPVLGISTSSSVGCASCRLLPRRVALKSSQWASMQVPPPWSRCQAARLKVSAGTIQAQHRKPGKGQGVTRMQCPRLPVQVSLFFLLNGTDQFLGTQ